MVSLIVLVGIPGCGKSTYAQSLKNEDTIVLSSDLIRKELFNDEQNQGKNTLVFDTLFDRAVENLRKGRNVVIDATNIIKNDRAKLLDNFKDLNILRKAIVIHTPIEICIERDLNRTRNVGEEVILRMANDFEMPTKEEGFDEISVVEAK